MASSLRILHVVPYFEGAWAYGGIPRAATALTRALVRRGHHVTVCTTDACEEATRLPPAAHASATSGLELRVFRNLSNRLAYDWQLFAPVGLGKFLRRTVDRFDIAHLHGFRNLPGARAARVLTRARVPYVVTPNGTAPAIERRILAKRLFDLLVGRRVLTGASRVLAVSLAEHDQLVTLGVPARRIALVPNPLDEEGEFGRVPDPASFRRRHQMAGPLVMYLGKLTPRKGVDVLLRALSQVRLPCHLVVAGNDMGSGRLVDQLIRDLNLGARVTRLGLQRGPERLEALAAADVVVYPSRDEVFGLVPLEALLCGTPVVVSNDSGCGEIIGRTGGGHIVPFGDAATLAGAIDSVLAAPAVWRARVRAASARVRELFGADIVSERLEAVYHDVLRHHRASAAQPAECAAAGPTPA